jgi:hypothetical protein
MFDSKELSKHIRDKKKRAYRPDMDSAGQEGVPPEAALAADLNAKVSATLDDPDHEPASEKEMGEEESSQSLEKRKKVSARLNSYFDSMDIKG